MTECTIKILEQPAASVKFRMVVQSHRCQNKELIHGRTTQTSEDYSFFPTVQVVGRLRENTIVRMSLVDVRSTPDKVMDHFHRIVDCRSSPDPVWSVERRMGPDGRAVFKELGIVKSLEAEKVSEVTERMICRREEAGDDYARNKWERTQISHKAEQQCRETSSSRLKLCFEAFLRESSRVFKVSEPVFSEEILDLNNVSNGELSVQKLSICSDYVEGGTEVMVFTNKVNYSRSSFFADFFQLKTPEDETSAKVWERRVPIPESQLHTVGQHLGGLWFTVPMYNRTNKDQPDQLETPVNCYFQLVKTNKNNTVQARSDRLLFTFKPRRIMKAPVKRQLPDQIERMLNDPKLPKIDNFPVFVPTPMTEFVPVGPLMTIIEEPTVPVAEIPSMVLNHGSQGLDNVLSPRTPVSNMEQLSIRSPAPTSIPSLLTAHQSSASSAHSSHNVLSAEDEFNQLMNEGYSNTAISPSEAQYYGSFPETRSPHYGPPRSPIPHVPELPDILPDDLEFLNNISVIDGSSCTIVTDGHQTEDKRKSKKETEDKRKSKKDTKQNDIVEQMSKLIM